MLFLSREKRKCNGCGKNDWNAKPKRENGQPLSSSNISNNPLFVTNTAIQQVQTLLYLLVIVQLVSWLCDRRNIDIIARNRILHNLFERGQCDFDSFLQTEILHKSAIAIATGLYRSFSMSVAPSQPAPILTALYSV